MEKSNFIKSFDVCVSKVTHSSKNTYSKGIDEKLEKRGNIFTNYLLNIHIHITHSSRKDILGKRIGSVSLQPPDFNINSYRMNFDLTFLIHKRVLLPFQHSDIIMDMAINRIFRCFHIIRDSIGPLQHLSSRSNSGFEFAEILTDAGSRRLPVSVTRGVAI